MCRRFPPHLNNISTLPCETWNPHHAGATTALSEKETPEFIPSQLRPPNSPDFNPVDYSVWKYCKSRCTKHASLIWMNWNSDWEWSGPRWITSSLRKPFVSCVVDSCRSVMHVLYTFSCSIPHTLLSTGFKSGEFAGHSWGWINSGVSLSNNSIVARARWAFQVSQGSVETLFRCGEKRLQNFAANLLATRVLDYLRMHKLISKHQHGFLSHHSTVSNLLESVSDWTLALNNGHSVIVPYVDYAKAFDVVCHNKLLSKLSAYGITGDLIE